jgi:uncharacterized protein YecE (DUF72 family)
MLSGDGTGSKLGSQTGRMPESEPAEKLGAVRIGTCAFTAAGWPGAFYPAGMQPRDFLAYYATQFDSVEVDSTYYHSPPARTVEGWRLKTPDDFVFSAKVPQIVTHLHVHGRSCHGRSVLPGAPRHGRRREKTTYGCLAPLSRHIREKPRRVAVRGAQALRRLAGKPPALVSRRRVRHAA